MFMLSCVPDPKPSRDMLVVEGWIEDNDYPIVFVTSSITSTFREQGLTDIMDHLALDAEVKITYAGKSYQLFPKLDPNYLMTIYYTTKNLKGKVGGTYRLDVNWRGLHASGTTTIPEHGSIDSIAVERNKSIDTLYAVTAIRLTQCRHTTSWATAYMSSWHPWTVILTGSGASTMRT